MPITLRDYQQELFGRIRGAAMSGVRRPLVVAPTGAGKTVLFCHTVGRASENGRRSVILVHRQELLEQTSRTLRSFGIAHGVIASGKRPDPFQLVQVAMVGTVVNRTSKMQTPDLFVVDEAHHGAAKSYLRIFDAFPDAHIVGFTATPERLDGKGLGDVFDEIIPGPRVQWLMDNDHLSTCKYYAPPSNLDVSKVKKSRGDYVKKDLEEAMGKSSIMGDAVKHYQRLSAGMPAVAFCVTVDHARSTAEAFKAAGIPAGVIDGKMTRQDRAQIVSDLGTGKIMVLTSCEIINEGFDLPVVTTAILLRKTSSLGLHLQQIGRVLRTHPDKAHSIVIDHVGNLLKHGVAEQDRDWSLAGRPKQDRKENKGDGFSQCLECFAMYQGDECPECGWKKPAPVVEMEVIDVELEEFRVKPVSEAKTYSDLRKMAKAKGYKPGWAYHAAREAGIRTPFKTR